MIQIPWLPEPRTKKQVRNLLMVMLEDDTEDQPWMSMSDLQFWSASSLAHSLRIYARQSGLPWYVASMLPIWYRWPRVAAKKMLSPDLFVAFVPDRRRSSFDVDEEGGFPPFVLEVVSPSSQQHDQNDKLAAYEELGVREYVLFTPRADRPSSLTGYRRETGEDFQPWPPDEHGRLWSAILNLYLVVNGEILEAEAPDGRRLLTPEETDAAWRQAETARQEEAQARRDEAEARQRAEEALGAAQAEVQRLREELDRRAGK